MPSIRKQPPTPSILLASLRNTGYTLESAIADIIDNSIAAKASRISVQYRNSTHQQDQQRWIAICDNGFGMSEEELFQGMKFGSREKEVALRDITDLGRFGLGLKTASISQCKRLTVVSWQDGAVHAQCWDLEKISDSWDLQTLSETEIAEHPVVRTLNEDLNFDVRPHGTYVIWELIDRDFALSDTAMNEAMNSVKNHLALHFHRFMQKEIGFPEVILFDMNLKEIKPKPPFGPENNKCRYVLQKEEFLSHGYTVCYQPYVLPRSVNYDNASDYDLYAGKEGYQNNQGFYVYRNRRLIEKATWFQMRRKEHKTQLLRIMLDIPAELDELWAVDVRKSQITPPRDIRQRVDRIVESAMETARRLWDSGRRPTNIVRGDAIPMWTVEKRPSGSNIYTYRVNPRHIMYKMLLEHMDPGYKNLFKEYLLSLGTTFPYDRYYSDRIQNEDISVENDTDLDERLTNILKGLIEQGYSEEMVREFFEENETEFDPRTIEEFINYTFRG